MKQKSNAADIVRAYNVQREPERLAMKLSIMRTSPFGFLRGSAHLFWKRVQEAGVAAGAPAAWCSADQHLENFGTYRADNGLVYFDLNDFDEAALAPCDWDVLRLLASLLVAAPALNIAKPEARALATVAAEAYRRELMLGKARWIERRTATGAIDTLMAALKKRDLARLLDRRTVIRKGKRQFDPDSQRILPVSERDREALMAFTQELGKARGVKGYFNLVDAARRIAGTGSLGLPRFVLLVEGAGSPDGNVLLDLKAAQASSMVQVAGIAQPHWNDEAHRIVAVQKRCQVLPPGQLSAVPFAGQPYILKALQPDADRLNLADIAANRKLMADALRTMGHLIAWAQLRSSGRDGSATADELIAYAHGQPDLATRLVASARDLAAVVMVDYKDFCEGHDASGKKAA